MLTGIDSSAAATVAASTAAAPLMSHFIVSMDFGGLSERPPESNVIPLPTSATVLVASGCVYASRTSRGGRVEPMPTPIRPPYPAGRERGLVQHLEGDVGRAAACTAASASAAGDRSSGEVLTRSRTRLTALAITSPRLTAAPLASSVSTVTASDGAGVARYFRKRVRAEQRSGGDGLRLGGGPRGQRHGDRLNPVILNGRCLRAGRPQRRSGGPAECARRRTGRRRRARRRARPRGSAWRAACRRRGSW